MLTTSKELYEETIESQIRVWDDEIEHLDARADIVLAQIEDRYYGVIKRLRAKERELRRRLEESRAFDEGDTNWRETSALLATTASEMRAAITRAAQEIEHQS
jgi:hypothetical protein